MKVIGLGDNIIDKYIHTKTLYPGGNCVNFAVHAKKLGVTSAYLGVFGSDENGDYLMDTLKQLEVDISHSRQYEGENSICEVGLINGERVFLGWNEGGISKENPIQLMPNDLDYLKEFQLIHSSCYSMLPESEFIKIESLDTLVSFDFSEDSEYRSDKYLKKFCPYIDLAQFSGPEMTEQEIEQLIQSTQNAGAKFVLVTRGTKGSIFFDGNTLYKGTAELVTPIDTMGCGDSFVTAFVIFLLENGWTKEIAPTSDIIEKGLKKAAQYSAQNCFVEGAFGRSKRFDECVQKN
ncbi:PfkB family carbohydrate kinase [Priestia aryabhattai]|uniref:PfkB family carbohydrate kinase n=1 Tax=Priestia aryabhattai TaxID=412384 RepID=UPI0039824D96